MKRARRRKQIHLVHRGKPNRRARKMFARTDAVRLAERGFAGECEKRRKKRAHRARMMRCRAENRRQAAERFRDLVLFGRGAFGEDSPDALLRRAGLTLESAAVLAGGIGSFLSGFLETMSDDGDLAPGASEAAKARARATRARRGLR